MIEKKKVYGLVASFGRNTVAKKSKTKVKKGLFSSRKIVFTATTGKIKVLLVVRSTFTS